MQNINFSNNIKEFSINGDESRIIRFNPSDTNILVRFKNVEQTITEELQKIEETEEGIEILSKSDELVRKSINYIFDSDVCDIAFGNQSVVSKCNGKYLFENFLEAVMPIIKKEVEQYNKESKARVKKYTKAYEDDVNA